MAKAKKGTDRELPRMLVVIVGWMEYYAGAGNERPVGGGSYTKENVGYESCNFLDLDGKLRGYFRFRFGKINLKRIDPLAHKAPDLDNVLVVFVATDPVQKQLPKHQDPSPTSLPLDRRWSGRSAEERITPKY